MSSRKTRRPDTIPIHAGPGPDPEYGGVSFPIYQSSTFCFANTDEGAARFAGTDPGFKYTRLGNPTLRALAQAVAELEGGSHAICTATGMSAISTVMLALLRTGDHVVGTDAVYGPTRLLFERHLSRFGVESSWVATEDPERIRAALRPETRMLYVETPANPTIKITDLDACAKIAKQAGLLLVVDNTFASPLLQQPFRFGADIVLHSMTKYLNGHSDVVAGVLVTRDERLNAELEACLQTFGGTMDPHQAWLVLRGLRTLALRVRKAQENAAELAGWLERHPKISWVSYPGLTSHPQHDVAMRQMSGPGSMISFGVEGGYEAAKTMINSVRLATLAVSLGGVETLVEHPASMTHAGMPREEREESGITDDLIRMAVGCEDWEDLRDDLDQALRSVTSEAGMNRRIARDRR
jgi:methionine-gamma-lyase